MEAGQHGVPGRSVSILSTRITPVMITAAVGFKFVINHYHSQEEGIAWGMLWKSQTVQV